MSDFRETSRQLSNTPEQYEQQLMKEQATKEAIEFCNKLKNEIKNRANRGVYQVCGENRIIKIFLTIRVEFYMVMIIITLSVFQIIIHMIANILIALPIILQSIIFQTKNLMPAW